MRLALPLTLALLAAACSGGTEAENVVAANATMPEPLRAGWSEIFDQPADAAVDAFRRVSLRNGPYQAEGAGYRSTAIPTPMSNPESTSPNLGRFEAQGGKDRLDRVVFTLDLTDPERADEARTRFADMFKLVFDQLGVAGADVVKQPVLAEAAARGSVPGADWSVTREALKDAGATARRLIVTFSRPGATPAATASPRNG